MELVYLWVEDYKNIKKQGFNFSPRFECEYDEDTYELKIEKKEYTSIFPDNINVTAIVGENGSGKSSVLINIANELHIHDYIFVFKRDEEKIILSNISHFTYPSEFKKYYYPHYPPQLPSSSETTDIKNFLQQKELLKKQIYLYDYSFEQNNASVYNIYPNKHLSISEIKLENMKNILYYIKDSSKHKKVFGDYFNPTQVVLKHNSTKKVHRMSINTVKIYTHSLSRKDVFKLRIYEYILILLNSLRPNNPINNVKDVNTMEDLQKFILAQLKSEEESQQNTEEQHKKIVSTIKEYVKYIEKIDSLNEFEKNISIENKHINLFIIDAHFLTDNFFILKDLPNCFEIDFIDKRSEIEYDEIYYNDLSQGEKSILNIKYYIEKLVQQAEEDHFIILLDEPANELHPEWQKKFLNYLINSFKKRKQKFHFIITTHSPFILSDLPKENVVFLEKEKGEDGKCKNVTNEIDIETFGANIHTLLSHGFFMKDGLMGEFAKGQINEAITKLNQTKLSEDDIQFCENIIKITGEPIIKRQMQKMLDSKRLSKMDAISKKIEDMSYELEVLKGYQAQYVKDELNDRAKKQYKQRKNDDKDTE
jgi:predicted ATPase